MIKLSEEDREYFIKIAQLGFGSKMEELEKTAAWPLLGTAAKWAGKKLMGYGGKTLARMGMKGATKHAIKRGISEAAKPVTKTISRTVSSPILDASGKAATKTISATVPSANVGTLGKGMKMLGRDLGKGVMKHPIKSTMAAASPILTGSMLTGSLKKPPSSLYPLK